MGIWGWREAADLGENIKYSKFEYEYMKLMQRSISTLTLDFSVFLFTERGILRNKSGYYLFFKRSGIGEDHVYLEFNPVKDEGSKWLYVMKVESLV